MPGGRVTVGHSRVQDRGIGTHSRRWERTPAPCVGQPLPLRSSMTDGGVSLTNTVPPEREREDVPARKETADTALTGGEVAVPAYAVLPATVY